MQLLAKTDAAGGAQIHPEVLAFGSSLASDLRLFREDVLGSLAHVRMLGEIGVVAPLHVEALTRALHVLQTSKPVLPEEEDIHMAIEVWLGQTVPDSAGYLHTGRSRNDQVALALRLHVREACIQIERQIQALVQMLLDRSITETNVAMPAYTHRQRAQPITFGFWLLSHATAFVRDIDLFARARAEADICPLGACAVAGSTLPLDRARTAALLGFPGVTNNALDTVGDRDFALDFIYACTRFGIHASRLSTDVIDFATGEFGFLKLGSRIASGSSMMPQKRNPDVFELVRGKSGTLVGDLVSLLVTMKGLPSGYNRDQQEDRGPIFGAEDNALACARVLTLALPEVSVDSERMFGALAEDATQATDLAEALVLNGVPFREAYQLVGVLVRKALDAKLPLAQVPHRWAQELDARFDATVLERLNVTTAAARKITSGSTGVAALRSQQDALKLQVDEASARTALCPTLDQLERNFLKSPLKVP
jgi:argininosuccinate lyase